MASNEVVKVTDSIKQTTRRKRRSWALTAMRNDVLETLAAAIKDPTTTHAERLKYTKEFNKLLIFAHKENERVKNMPGYVNRVKRLRENKARKLAQGHPDVDQKLVEFDKL